MTIQVGTEGIGQVDFQASPQEVIESGFTNAFTYCSGFLIHHTASKKCVLYHYNSGSLKQTFFDIFKNVAAWQGQVSIVQLHSSPSDSTPPVFRQVIGKLMNPPVIDISRASPGWNAAIRANANGWAVFDKRNMGQGARYSGNW